MLTISQSRLNKVLNQFSFRVNNKNSGQGLISNIKQVLKATLETESYLVVTFLTCSQSSSGSAAQKNYSNSSANPAS